MDVFFEYLNVSNSKFEQLVNNYNSMSKNLNGRFGNLSKIVLDIWGIKDLKLDLKMLLIVVIK